MECNKEEAIRAKSIAENKMLSKDFVGARKVVLKAQQLFPDLENVSQMLTVCEVHCSAGIKVNGETDWYGILQVELTVDESSIKKQYRKLALLLHPDKNKFAGAEAAFKLIGEAHRTLTDQAKRSLHDMKRIANIKVVPQRQPSQQSNRPSYARMQPGVPNNLANKTTQFNGSNHQQQPSASGAETFWTMCPFCSIRYQYFLSILNKPLRCQSCLKPFIAYDLNVQGTPGANLGSGIPQQEFPAQAAHTAGNQKKFGSGTNTELGGGSTTKVKCDAKMGKEAVTGNNVKFQKVNLEEVSKREPVVKPSAGNTNRKRGRKVEIESSGTESSDSEDVVVEEDINPAGQNAGTSDWHYPRRSTRQKQNISYNEDKSDDDDFVSPGSRRPRKGGSSGNTDGNGKAFSEGDANGVKVQTNGAAISKDKKEDKEGSIPPEESLQNGNESLNKYKMNEREEGSGEEVECLKAGGSSKANSSAGSSSKTSPDLDTFSYPDPEFYDFEKDRDASQFAVDQIWAVYDDLDGMPRFYARIRKVFGPDFRLRFTWLEHDPISEAEMEWHDEDLPIACGSFKIGKSEYTEDRPMFSHLMSGKEGTRRNSYAIYPRKGEVWALFKGWDIRWSSDADNHRFYEYDVVELLSDYSEGTDICLIHLVKVKGFVSLFIRAVDEGPVPLHIPSNEILRFSHRVPSYRMTGGEREGIPKGSFELDSASLPSNFDGNFPSISLDSIMQRFRNLDSESNGLCSKAATVEVKHATGFENTNTPTKKSEVVNQKNVLGKGNLRNRDLSSKGMDEASEKRHNQASESRHSAEQAWKHVESEAMAPRCQVDEKEENIDACNPNTNNAAGHHNASAMESPSSISYEYPDPEFYKFEDERSIEKIRRGQIWALYSDIDRYPKYYARIRKVEDFQVHVTWLEACSIQQEATRWLEEGLPIGCGTFKIEHETDTFDSSGTFSHLVQAKSTGRKDQYHIYPIAGEVWAVYKNWSIGWTRSDLDSCEYDVVEVLRRTDSGIQVSVLKKVDGYSSVFMPERKVVRMEIPAIEYLRFSHKIPAFQLTEEKGGKLRGYWELDPASVPDSLLFTNSD